MMRYKVTSILSVLILFCVQNVFSAQLIDPTKLFGPEHDEKEEQVTHLKDELEKIKASTQERLKVVQDALTQVNRQAADVKTELQEAPAAEQDFLAKKSSLLNEINQTLFNIQLSLNEIPSLVEQRIKLLEENRKDPTYKALILEPRSFYSYDVFQNEIKRVFDQEDKIKILTTQKNDETIELENSKKKLAAAQKNYQEKKKEQEEFAAKISTLEEPGQLGFKQRGELLDLEEKRASYEQELSELRVQAASKKIEFITTNISIEQEKLIILKNNLARAKAGLRIAESEVKEARDTLEKFKQKSLATKETHYEEIKRLSGIRDKLRKELEAISKRHKVPILEREEFATWSVETPSVESYSTLCEMGYKNEQIQLLYRKIESLRAEIQLEDVKFRREEIKTTGLVAWYDLAQRKVVDSEEVLQELKRFRELEAEINRELNSFQDKRNAETNLLNFQNKELTNLRNLIQEIDREREGVFKRYPLRYNACLVRLAEAEKIIGEQIDTISKLLEVYSGIISILNGTEKETSIIISELETRSIWQRSQYAVSWQGVKNIFPDLGYFVADVRQIGATYLSSITWKSVVQTVTNVLRTPGRLLLLLLFMILIIGFYFVLRYRLPFLREQLLGSTSENRFLAMGIKVLGCFCAYLERYLFGIYIWAVFGLALYVEAIPDLFPRIIFFFVSIPYLMYYLRKLIRFFVSCNRQYEFPIFTELFEKRFSLVFSIFAYMTVFVLFFREAFMLATIHKSELPNILLAAYSIILRTLIIFSIGKDEILALITKPGPFWTWIARMIESYYYPLLLAIIFLMIMSDPYVGGYGNLVSYAIWGLIGTIILGRLLYLLHSYTKQYSEYIFFSTDEEEVKRERFSYAKTWYGIFVIALFVVFIILGIAIGTKIWGVPIALEDISNVFNFQLFSTGMEKGEPIWFTPYKLLVVVSFIIAGFFVAMAFNRFVLQRIFDILPVDIGVQNTVISITRYLIIAITIFLGFQRAELGNLLIAIGLVIGSIGYILKESIGDFISYFIILVQRPIQIGDYIMISDDIQGVVRKITPRSVILRRKDSYTIIVPNSSLLTNSINNWTYARNFIAFDDIYLTIAYSADPIKVKEIIHQVLDESNDILKSPRPIIRLHEFGEYGFVFMTRGFISNINILRRWDIASDIRFSIIKALQENNIRLAVPTRLILRDEHFKEQ